MKKQSKLSVLLNIVFENPTFSTLNLNLANYELKKWISNHSNLEIENLADDLGYWYEIGNYEYSIEFAKKKLFRLINWFTKSYETKKDKTNYTLYLFHSFSINKFDLKTQIKLTLYAMKFYKSPRIVHKYLKKVTGIDVNEIEEKFVKFIISNPQKIYKTNIISGLGGLHCFLCYYYEDENYLNNLIKNTLIKLYANSK